MRTALLKLSTAAVAVATCLLAISAVRSTGHRFAHVVDLTHSLSEDTPYIPVPGITFPFKKTPIATIAKNGVAANRWEIPEHIGTQIDAPRHFFEDGGSLERLPVASLVVSLVVIDVSARTSSNPDTSVTVADIEAWERRNGRLPPRSDASRPW
jgi:kynurenine formamidase